MNIWSYLFLQIIFSGLTQHSPIIRSHLNERKPLHVSWEWCGRGTISRESGITKESEEGWGHWLVRKQCSVRLRALSQVPGLINYFLLKFSTDTNGQFLTEYCFLIHSKRNPEVGLFSQPTTYISFPKHLLIVL